MAQAEVPVAFMEAVEGYSPNDGVRQELARKFIIPIVGPTAVGKSTLIEQACQLEPESFHRVQTFTTRPRRPDEPENMYRFLAHDAQTLEVLEERVASGSLVQIIRHPTTGYLYGSEPDDYPASYNLLDTLSGEVGRIRRLPFAQCIPVAVAVESGYWHAWFMNRYRNNPDPVDAEKRLQEADTCLDWALWRDPEVMWAQNYPLYLQKSAVELTTMIKGDRGSSKEARSLAIRMQNIIPKLREQVRQEAA